MKKSLILLMLPWVSAIASLQKVLETQAICPKTIECKSIRKKLSSLNGKNIPMEELKDRLKIISLDNSVKSYEYNIITTPKGFKVKIIADFFKKVSEINFSSNIDFDWSQVFHLIPIKKNQYAHPKSIEKSIEIVNKYLENKGLSDISISHDTKQKNNKIKITFNISVGTIKKITEVKVFSDNKELLKHYQGKINSLKNQKFNRLKIKVVLGEIAEELVNSGHHFSNVSLQEAIFLNKQDVLLKINLHFGDKYQFYFRGNTSLSRFEFMEAARMALRVKSNAIPKKSIKSSILKKYEEIGLHNVSVQIRSQNTMTKKGIKVVNFYVDIIENKKTKIKQLIFFGNSGFNSKKIEKIYYEQASPLAAGKYFDKKYLAQFPKILKKRYSREGFIFADISKYRVKKYQDRDEVVVSFKISEGKRCLLEEINIPGIPFEMAEKIKSTLVNKEMQPINLVEVENDINHILDQVREEGYFFAKITNLSKNTIMSYQARGSVAKMNVDIDLGKKSLFQSSLITGHTYTADHVIKREITLKEGEVITQKKLHLIKENINSLGLFSRVKITPYIAENSGQDDTYRVNLLVQVQEKDFGVAEFSPGYRTDIGIKFSALVLYNNLWGINHSVSTKGQLNQRLDTSDLEAKRRARKTNRLEGLLRSNYTWPRLLNFADLSSTLSLQRRRFYSFDADIIRISPKIKKTFTDTFSASITYQFEKIRQFDASEEKDQDSFKIGSITPSLSIDYRDHPIHPTKGGLIRLSWEFANPDLNFESEDKKIDFSKLVARGKFYFSHQKWLWAFSVASGVQWNYSKQPQVMPDGALVRNQDGSIRTLGYIPSIKVFRLDGIDSVRGFADSEINRTIGGEEINRIRIQDKAWFANLKIEPRYHWDGNFIMGLFFDAGRLFVDSFKPLKLRTSVGLSFKFLTPVGTLDFDYGIKLKRRTFPDGVRESFGRFHLSIGYF